VIGAVAPPVADDHELQRRTGRGHGGRRRDSQGEGRRARSQEVAPRRLEQGHPSRKARGLLNFNEQSNSRHLAGTSAQRCFIALEFPGSRGIVSQRIAFLGDRL
jgi:hypothetical protein